MFRFNFSNNELKLEKDFSKALSQKFGDLKSSNRWMELHLENATNEFLISVALSYR